MQGDVGLPGAHLGLGLGGVVALYLVGLKLGHLHAMLDPAATTTTTATATTTATTTPSVGGRGGHHQGLLGGAGRRGQVERADLLGHQLLLDLVDEHQVIQLKGSRVSLRGQAQQTTATRV